MSRFLTNQIPQKQYSSVISITTTQDYAIPSYLRKCSVFILGAGGGGGGGAAYAYDVSTSLAVYGGNGGASGEFIRIDFNDLYSLGSTLKCVIGAGGSGGGGGAASAASEGGSDNAPGSDGTEGSPSSISINGFKIQARGGAGGTLGLGSTNYNSAYNTAVDYTFTEIGDKNDYYSYLLNVLNFSQIIRYGSVARGAGSAGNSGILLTLPDPITYHPLISDAVLPFIGSYFNISGTLIDTVGGYTSGADGDSNLVNSVYGYAGGGVAGAPSAIANSPSNATADGGVTWASASGTAGGAGADGAANTGVGGGGGGGSANSGSSSNPKTATGGAGGDGGSGKIIILY